MTDFDSLREDIGAVADSLARYSLAVSHATGEHDLQLRKLWADNAELRDELHALANRVEALTRVRLTEPAEVVERIIQTTRDDWRDCSECGVSVYRDGNGAIRDSQGLHTCKVPA